MFEWFVASPNSWLIVLGFVLLISELIIVWDEGFDSVLLGINLIIGGLVGRFLEGQEQIYFASWVWALGIVGVLSMVHVFFLRNWIKRKLELKSIPSNVDALQGASGIVRHAIAAGEAGQVEIHGEIWRAHSDKPIEVDARIKAIRAEGVTLWVEEIKDTPPESSHQTQSGDA